MRVGDNLQVLGATHDHQASVALTFQTSLPIKVVRWGLICGDEAIVGTGTAVLGHQPFIAAGTTTRNAAAGTATMAIIAAVRGYVQYVEPTTEIVCKPGDILDVTIDGAFTSGDVYAFIQYQLLNWDENGDNANFADATPTTKLVDSAA